MVAVDALCRQLAYHHAGDAQTFDVVELAFSLAVYIDTSSTPMQTAVGGTATNGSPQSTPLNSKLVSDALAVIFKEQNDDGTWSKGALYPFHIPLAPLDVILINTSVNPHFVKSPPRF